MCISCKQEPSAARGSIIVSFGAGLRGSLRVLEVGALPSASVFYGQPSLQPPFSCLLKLPVRMRMGDVNSDEGNPAYSHLVKVVLVPFHSLTHSTF